jgi:uncharacterized protein (DUF305 family)
MFGGNRAIQYSQPYPFDNRSSRRELLRMPRRSIPAVIAAAVLLTVPVGCSDDERGDATTDASIVQLGAPGGTNRELTVEEAAALEVPSFTQSDVDFVHSMIAHHQQALAMTALVSERTERDTLPVLAERMDVSQRDEIELMERWLDERDVQLPDGDDHAAHTGLMPGMLTPDELEALTDAEGPEFDRLFLESMIRHHQGAVIMIETLLTGGEGGQESEVFQLAQNMEADQQVEISRMLALLAELEP